MGITISTETMIKIENRGTLPQHQVSFIKEVIKITLEVETELYEGMK